MIMWLSLFLIVTGIAFFCAGTVGLLRFPDVYNRLHALTKADNLGLGLVALGLAIVADSWTAALQILFIWLLVLPASATAAHVIARAALRDGVPVWRRR